MLASSRSTRLCHSCRYDLLRIFDYGLAGPASSSRAFPLRPRARRDGQRPFSQSSVDSAASRRGETPGIRQRTARARGISEGLAKHEIREEPTPETAEAENFSLLQKWETQSLSSERMTDEQASNYELRGGLEPGMSDGETPVFEDADPIALLRASGASKDDIVREARQRFGQSLPEGALNGVEFAHYLRLYGEPEKELFQEEQIDEDESAEHEEGERSMTNRVPEILTADGEAVEQASETPSSLTPEDADLRLGDPIAARQPMAIAEARIRDIALSLGGEVYEKQDDLDDSDEDDGRLDERAHPLTTLGKFATFPRTVFLPQDSFVKPIEKMLADYSNKHLKEMCEKTFGGKGLPDSPLTPYSARQMQQLPIPMDASQHLMGEMEANAYLTAVMPPVYATVMSVLTETRKRLGSSWLRNLILKEGGPRILDAGAGGAGILAWNEIVKAEWALMHGSEAALETPPPPSRAVVLTGSDTLRHRASALLENTTFVPRLPDYVHTRDLPTLDDSRQVQRRKEFDVVIAPHTLFPLKEDYLRKQHVQNLWSLVSPAGGVLVVLEKGIPRGFEAVAGAREFLLDRYIASPGSESYESPLSNSLAQKDQVMQKGKGMIIAPCTNHNKCPMYTIPGVAGGRKDFCAFQQRFIRPSFMQRVMEGTHFNDQDVNYSYIAVLKGEDLREKRIATWEELVDPMIATELAGDSVLSEKDSLKRSFRGYEVDHLDLSTDSEKIKIATKAAMADFIGHPLTSMAPRLVFPPLKRKGHITMDLCTSAGKIERWTVPKSFSYQAYRDARKSRWGDLWTLGAKTRVDRNLKCGTVATKEGRKMERKRRRAAEKEDGKREKAEEEAFGVESGVDKKQEMMRAAKHGAAMNTDTGRSLGAEEEEGDDDDDDELLELEQTLSALKEKNVDAGRRTAEKRTPKIDHGFGDDFGGEFEHGHDKENALEDNAHNGEPEASMFDDKRLLDVLANAQSEDEVHAALKEWEDEYAADQRAAKSRDGRRREGRDKSRARARGGM